MRKNITVDLETTGLNPRKERITCIGVDGDGISRVYRSVDRFNHDVTTGDLKDCDFTGQKFSFDIGFLVHNGVDLDLLLARWVDDTQLMAHVCTDKVTDKYLEWYEIERRRLNKLLPKGVSHREGRKNSLKVFAPFFLDVPPFWEDPQNHDDDEYVLKDCRYTTRSRDFFEKRLKELGQYDFYKNRMMPWAKMLLQSELRGIKLNWQNLYKVEEENKKLETGLLIRLDHQWWPQIKEWEEKQEYELQKKYLNLRAKATEKLKDKSKRKQLWKRYSDLYQKAAKKLPPFNFNSPAQLLWLLKDALGKDVKDWQGNESTAKAVLEKLSNSGHKDVEKLLEYRKANKILTMYVPTYKELQYDGTIHPSFNITGTRTGRLSSSKPNLQQVPSTLYKVFKPREGYKFIQYDLSGIEAALIALYSEDVNLFDTVTGGQSIHNANAKIFLGLDCEVDEVKDKYPTERQAAKNVGFGLFYGSGWRQIQRTFMNAGIPVTDREAKDMLKRFKEHYRSAFEFHDKITTQFAKGEIINNLMGRPIKIGNPDDAYMKGFNTLVQSSASDLCMRGAERATQAWREAGLDCHNLLYVHDCIVAECKAEDATRASEILVDSMTNFKLTNRLGQIKLQVEGGVYDEWRKD
jgi:DNA polymerase I-like protein with 3'-5' exonuclease and polymerase domains